MEREEKDQMGREEKGEDCRGMVIGGKEQVGMGINS